MIKVIDFHTHIFPPRVAPLAIKNLSEACNAIPQFDGTVDGLIKDMEANGVDISVCMPIITNARHTVSINNYAIEVNKNNKNVISFGSLNPFYENNEEEIKRLKENNIMGVKMHPVYQNCPVDSEESIKLINSIIDNGMYILLHAGKDPGFPGNDYSSVDRMVNMLNKIHDESKIILAHLGGLFDFYEAYEKLAGRGIYLDTAMSFDKCHYSDGTTRDLIDDELFIRLVKKHGSDKILFGTDNPWVPSGEMLEYFNKFNLSDNDKENILYKNACNILNIKR